MKNGMWVWIYNTILLLVVTSLTVVSAYLADYSIFSKPVSSLGNHIINPKGYWVFNTGLFIMSIGLLIPLAKMYNSFESPSRISLISFIYMSLGALFGCLVAIFNENYKYHLFLAILMFCCYGLGLLLLLIHAILVQYVDIFIFVILIAVISMLCSFGILVPFKCLELYQYEWIAVFEMIFLFTTTTGYISCT